MANTDPVSGLMASMARVRNRKPDGIAMEAGTALQAGTVLPTPKPPKPVAMRPSSFEQVLPAPQAAQVVEPTPIPQPVPETPSMGLTEPLMGIEEEDPKNTITRVAGKLMESGDGLDLADAYVLSLGYYYGIPK
jgi:hypothetical protein